MEGHVSAKLLSSQDGLLVVNQSQIHNWFPPDIQLDLGPSPDNQFLDTLEIGIPLKHQLRI